MSPCCLLDQPWATSCDGPLVGHLAEVGVGLRLLDRSLQLDELPLGLFELLVEIGRGNRRQDLVFATWAPMSLLQAVT